jgi:RNA polymerase subunit RPABC4/transcription elongation factor Spt4
MTPFLLGWPGGSLDSALKLGALILISYALVLWLSAVIWVYRDVRNRTGDPASQLIAVLLVAVFNVPGLIVYLVIRPQTTIADAYEKSLETEAILHELQITASSCQTCQRPIEDDFIVCPHCRTILREGCRNCGRSIRTSWVTCPYCATDRLVVRPPRPERGIVETEPLQPPSRSTTPRHGNGAEPRPRPAATREG